MNEAKRLALTGAGGALGSQILAQCDADLEIFALTSNPKQLQDRFSGRENLHFYNRDAFAQIPWNTIDVLVNCAFPMNADGAALAEGMRYVERLFAQAMAGGVRAVINISSQSVYNQKRAQAAVEQDAPDLGSVYAAGKYATELLLEALCMNIPHTSLRMANLVGAHTESRVLNRFAHKIAQGEEIQIWNNNRFFDYLDMRDAADAVLTLAGSDARTWEPVYNIGTEKVHGVLELAEMANKVAKENGLLPVRISCSEGAEEGESRNTALCCRRFGVQFHWEPRYTVKDTAAMIFACMSNRGGVIPSHNRCACGPWQGRWAA